jgi:Ni,Fe-hydrogenase I cytochrome b subunit
LKIEKDNLEFYLGLGLMVAGFILGLISFTGASLGGSAFTLFVGSYASALHWVIGMIALLLFVTGLYVLIPKSK